MLSWDDYHTEDTAPASAGAATAEAAAPVEAAVAEEAAPAEAPAAAEEAPVDAEAPAEETTVAEDAPAGDEPAAEEPADDAQEAAAASTEVATHTYDELKGMTVVQMREIAESLGDHDELHGYTTMHKEELLVALCKAQGVEAHEHHEVVGIDKAAVKAKIRELKQQREALIAAGDRKQLKIVRRRIRGLKRKIHKATV